MINFGWDIPSLLRKRINSYLRLCIDSLNLSKRCLCQIRIVYGRCYTDISRVISILPLLWVGFLVYEPKMVEIICWILGQEVLRGSFRSKRGNQCALVDIHPEIRGFAIFEPLIERQELPLLGAGGVNTLLGLWSLLLYLAHGLNSILRCLHVEKLLLSTERS